MLAWAPPEEVFVNIRGLIDICFKSDDPLFYEAPIDLWDKQQEGKGLSEEYGKKNKKTAIQSYFKCHPCEVEVQSVVTLRAHCQGSQHIIKALRAEREAKGRASSSATSSSSTSSSTREQQGPKDLFAALRHEKGIIIGYRYITEYTDPQDPARPPLYHCSIPGCLDVQGNSADMAMHIVSIKHLGAWTQEQGNPLGPIPSRIQVIEFVRQYHETPDRYGEISTVQNTEEYEKCKKKQIKGAGFKREIKDEKPRDLVHRRHDNDMDDKRRRDRDDDRHDPASYNDRRRREYDQDQRPRRDYYNDNYDEERRERDQKRHIKRRVSPDDDHRQSSSRRRRHSPGSPRGGSSHIGSSSSVRDRSPRGRSSRRPPRPKRERSPEDDEDVRILRQQGTFNFKDVSNVPKPESRRDEDDGQVETLQVNAAPEPPERTEAAILKEFSDKVLDSVKRRLNPHFAGSPEFDNTLERITENEYKFLAKEFHLRFKQQFKDSYDDYNYTSISSRTYRDLQLTPDMRLTIHTQINHEFDGLLRQFRRDEYNRRLGR